MQATIWKPITNATAFQQAVVIGETEETRHLDFKAGYGWKKTKQAPAESSDQREEVCRDIAQFANTEGGTLLVGVGEKHTADGRAVADRFCAVEDVDGFKKWVEQSIRNYLTPSTFSRAIIPIVLPSGTIVAINIPPSLHLVALWHDNAKRGLEYLYRTDHGKEWMNPDEVERHIMNGSRAVQIALRNVLAEAKRPGTTNPRVELTPAVPPLVKTQGFETLYTPVALTIDVNATTDRALELRADVPGGVRNIRVPLGLINEVWLTTGGDVGLCLKVAVVIAPDGDLALSPLPFPL